LIAVAERIIEVVYYRVAERNRLKLLMGVQELIVV